VLSGWGGKEKGFWTAGNYRVEIWWNNKKRLKKNSL